MDGAERYLAVHESLFWVYAGDKASGEPLLRYHYRRAAGDDVPSAHLHVHAHRDAVSYVMARSGEGTRRGKRRARMTEVPHLYELDFPLGGHRFRPCLEDLLEMLVTEFGVDSTAAGLESLRTGGEQWRRKQLRSVVRDDPREVAAQLRSMGYSVDWTASSPEPDRHSTRFRDF